MKLNNLLFCFFSFIVLNLFSQTISKIKLFHPHKTIVELLNNHLNVYHIEKITKNYSILMIENKELEILKHLGLNYQIMIEDLTAFYQKRNKEKWSTNPNNYIHRCKNKVDSVPIPALFSLGSMGGYYTWSEAIAKLDLLKQQYPNLISSKSLISNIHSFEGRPIWYVKISDNADIDENETEVLYTSIHHSQEPASLQQLIFFMMYLLENYSTNQDIKYLIDNLELYFVPIINPDGYVYNQSQNPQGGGMWRKNRRANIFYTYGVDLNRNYGYMWGYDNMGSHDYQLSPWYRGEYAFSEPETQAMKNFIESRNFKMALNWHSYGNFIIYPWNYINYYTNDSVQYMEYAKEISALNRYRYGTVAETYGYQSNGDADDWNYGEVTTKQKIISLTGEAGNFDDGFWPPISRIIPICFETLDMNIKFAELNLAYARVLDNSPSYISNSGSINYTVFCLGIDTPSTFQINFISLTPQLQFINPTNTFANMNLLEKRNATVSYTISGNIQQGTPIRYVISINNGSHTRYDTITKTFGNLVTLFYDPCENTNQWIGNWGFTTEQAYSGQGCITDSPNSTYGNFATSILTTASTINLTGLQKVWLEFMAKWDLERGYDYTKVEISTDGGNTWTALCGLHSSFGSDDLDTPDPLYDGKQSHWIREEIDLSNYVGQTIKIRFYLKSDQSNGNYDGFYFDDLKVIGIPHVPAESNFIIHSSVYCDVFPNPATNQLNIFSNLNNTQMIVYDIYGQVVKTINFEKNKENINIENLTAGMYFCVFKNAEIKPIVIKLIIQK